MEDSADGVGDAPASGSRSRRRAGGRGSGEGQPRLVIRDVPYQTSKVRALSPVWLLASSRLRPLQLLSLSGHKHPEGSAVDHAAGCGMRGGRVILREQAELVEAIAKLVEDKVLEGVTNVRDESDRTVGVRVVIEVSPRRASQRPLRSKPGRAHRRSVSSSRTPVAVQVKPSADPHAVRAALYQHTRLETRFATNMVALVGGTPQQLTLKQFLQHFLDFRQAAFVAARCCCRWRSAATARGSTRPHPADSPWHTSAAKERRTRAEVWKGRARAATRRCEVVERRARHERAAAAKRLDQVAGYLVASQHMDQVVQVRGRLVPQHGTPLRRGAAPAQSCGSRSSTRATWRLTSASVPAPFPGSDACGAALRAALPQLIRAAPDTPAARADLMAKLGLSHEQVRARPAGPPPGPDF